MYFLEAIKGLYNGGLIVGMAFNVWVMTTRQFGSMKVLDFALGINLVTLVLGITRFAVNDPDYNPMWIGADVCLLGLNRFVAHLIGKHR